MRAKAMKKDRNYIGGFFVSISHQRAMKNNGVCWKKTESKLSEGNAKRNTRGNEGTPIFSSR